MGKLVRDRIPEIMREEGLKPATRILDGDVYLESLLEKLVEEARELQEAAVPQRLEEAADVLEVLTSLVRALGHTMVDVETQAIKKRSSHGGFDNRIWLET